MKRFQKIMVVLGQESLGPRHAVLERATRLARENRASLRLVTIVEEFPRVARWLLRSADDLMELIEKERLQRVEALAAAIRNQGVEATASVLRGRIGLDTVREVLRHGPDLLIKDAEERGDRLVGSSDWHLLRGCPCPVFLVRPAQEGHRFGRILAAVDPAPIPDATELVGALDDQQGQVRRDLNRKIIELASSLAGQEQGELHVLHAWHVPGETLLRGEAWVPQKEVDEYVESMEVAARRALDGLITQTASALEHARVHFIKGDAAEVIVRWARSHSGDLIVLGTVARTGIPSLIIGNTAEAVLRRVECSVLTVKPDGLLSPVNPV